MSNNNILNRAFSKKTFLDLIEKKDSVIYSKIVKRYLMDEKIDKNRELISAIYNIMQKEYRNEYFYKNTMLNKLLLGRHSLNTTTALTEVTIGKSKADFILINGKATLYEIKTELDSLDRLQSQLENYYKAFDYIYVITHESHLTKVLELLKDSTVGVCVLTKRNTISEVKKAQIYRDDFSYEVMFKILRKSEYEELIFNHYGKLPNVTPVKYYSSCFELFKKIEMSFAYDYFINILKKRSKVIIKEFKNIVPKELSSLVYFANFEEYEYKVLNEFLNDKYRR